MTATILGSWTDGSEQWHAAREGRVGGSEVGTICGWSPWESRAQLLHRKAGLLAPRPQTSAMQRGHLLEPAFASYTLRFNQRAFDYIAAEVDRFLADLDALKEKRAA